MHHGHPPNGRTFFLGLRFPLDPHVRGISESEIIKVCPRSFMTFHILGTPYIFQGSFILYDPNSAWWFGTMEFYGFPETVGNIIIPTDELSYFSGGRYTTNQLLKSWLNGGFLTWGILSRWGYYNCITRHIQQ